MSFTPRQEELKARFVAARGYWSDLWDGLLMFDPDYFERFLAFSSHPGTHGLIEPKVRSFIGIAVDSASTHMYATGLRAQIEGALKNGATVDEVFAVLELTSGLGTHTMSMAMPVLLEELAAAGDPVSTDELTERQAEIKAQFVEKHGHWPERWDGLLVLDTDFFEILVELSDHAMRADALDPRVRELILIALAASPTHLYEPALREHVRAALEGGVTKEEILAVLEMVSGLGVHTMAIAIPALREALDATKQ